MGKTTEAMSHDALLWPLGTLFGTGGHPESELLFSNGFYLLLLVFCMWVHVREYTCIDRYACTCVRVLVQVRD